MCSSQALGAGTGGGPENSAQTKPLRQILLSLPGASRSPWPKAEDPSHLPAPSSENESPVDPVKGISGQLEVTSRTCLPPPSTPASTCGCLRVRRAGVCRVESRAGLDHLSNGLIEWVGRPTGAGERKGRVLGHTALLV